MSNSLKQLFCNHEFHKQYETTIAGTNEKVIAVKCKKCDSEDIIFLDQLKRSVDMDINNLEKCFHEASQQEKKYVGVKIQMQQFEEPQIIIDSNPSFDSRFSYYKKVFGENLKSAQGNRIVGFTHGDTFNEIEKDLI